MSLPPKLQFFRILSKLAVILMLLLRSVPLFSQVENYDQQWRWVHFTTEDGLPSNHITRFVESSNGTAWVSTFKGIAWYDNFQWIPIDLAKGLPQKSAHGMEIDLHDSLIVVVDQQLYRGNQNGFHLIPIKGVQYAIPFTEDELLVVARDTSYVYSAGKFAIFKPLLDITNGKPVDFLASTHSGIWLNFAGSVYRWEGREWKCVIRTNTYRADVTAFTENQEGSGMLYLRGLWQMWKWNTGSPPALNDRGNVIFVKSAAVGPDGGAIMVEESGDIRILREQTWSTLSPYLSNLHDIISLAYGRKGDLWICTKNGLYLYKHSLSRWKYIRHDGSDLRNLVNEIMIARDGRIWLGTAGGVEILSGDQSSTTINRINDKPIAAVTGLAEDNDGNIWISSGSAFSGTYRWNGSRWDYFKISGDSIGMFAHKIARDRRGRLWFLGLSPADKQPGAYVLDHDQFVHWGTGQEISSDRVYAFAEDSTGDFWFGTRRGLARWKPSQTPGTSVEQGEWKFWRPDSGVEKVFTLAVDEHNRLWLSDQYSGLYSIDENEQLRNVGIVDGLINNEVWNIVADHRGKLWIATRGGLSLVENGEWSNFDYRNGLPNPATWAVLPMKDRIFIGTLGSGLAILSLEESHTPPPKLSIDRPVIEEASALFRWHVYPYRGELSPEERFSRFRVDGGDWSPWGLQTEFTIEQLASGSHAFQVQAKGLFGKFDVNGQTRSFWIALPFYRQAVFLVPVSALGITTIILVVLIVIRKRRHTSALRKSEVKFRRLTEAAFEGIAIHDKGIIVDANQSILNMFGYEYDEFVGKSALDFTAPESFEVIRSNMLSDSESMYEAAGLKKDGSKIIVEIIGKTIPYENRTARVVAIRDITERKQAERRLLEYQAQLQSLASQLSLTEEKERRRIATYLHDYIGHTLAMCKLKLGEMSEANHNDALKEVTRLVDETIDNARSLTFELSPPVLHSFSLADSIEWLVEHFQEQHDLLILCEMDGRMEQVPDDLRSFLYHAVRELLVNVVKHARAHSAEVTLRQLHDSIEIKVQDNGCGFDPASVDPHATQVLGFGLFNIRERIASLGGGLEIRSTAGTGTTVILRVPLSKGNHV